MPGRIWSSGEGAGPRALFVDLNNFSLYPTIGVGYIVRSLRDAGWCVDVVSPLAHGVRGMLREPRSSLTRLVMDHANHRAATSPHAALRGLRRGLALARRRRHLGKYAVVATNVARLLDAGHYDIVLVSAYLMYYDVCERIGRVCMERGTPYVIGGAYLNQKEVARAWQNIPGLTALVGGEPERFVHRLAASAATDSAGLLAFPGVHLPSGESGPPPLPLRELDAVAFPDYSDFPWSRYPHPLVPIQTGRGCGWGACTFCSDITSSAGRTYRSRSPGSVMEELEWQSRRHGAGSFVFTDLKLNSNLEVWEALTTRTRERVPGARWIGAVHVDAKNENGLGEAQLAAARRSGLVRLTTGLESGSQRMLEMMQKGTDLEVTSHFIRTASQLGISVRVTMIVGYPGELPADVAASARFLKMHRRYLDRVNLNRFQIMMGTSFHQGMTHGRASMPGFVPLTVHNRLGQVDHDYLPSTGAQYRRAVANLVREVHSINSKRLPVEAVEFEGVM